jgi:hypothetical protein
MVKWGSRQIVKIPPILSNQSEYENGVRKFRIKKN